MDQMIRATDQNDVFRFFIAKTTDTVETMRQIHKTSPTATAALGRLSTMGLLIGADLKGERDQVTLKIKGDGPAGLMLAVANPFGQVRATMDHPNVDVPPKNASKLDVGALVGRNGTLAVIRDYGLKEPWSGVADLVSGEIAEDFAHYFAISEQQPSAISLGVLVGKEGEVSSAGGLVIQPMPFAKEAEIVQIEALIKEMPPISSLFESEYSPTDILEKYFGSLGIKIHSKTPLEYRCNCSREKITRALITLGREELLDMAEVDGGAEVICHFCNTNYQFTDLDLKEMALQAQSVHLDWEKGLF